jgi:CRISPR-associated endonuclease/helicase Cas3
MFFAHSIEGEEKDAWQPLAAHLEAVSRLSSLHAQKFGADRLGAIVGLQHDLENVRAKFRANIAGRGPSQDHATAGREKSRNWQPQAGLIASPLWSGLICIAVHHAGVPNWRSNR